MRAARAARRTARGAAVSAVLALLALPLLPAGQASAASYSVTMKGYAFSPANLTVPVGSTVTWTNQDTAPHDVKTTSGPVSIHSPMLNKGQSWSFTFTAAGAYGYYCTVHPNMTAGITVRPAAPAAPATPAAPTHEHSSGSSGSSGSTEHRAHTPPRTAASSKAPPMRMPSASSSATASGAAAPQTSPSPQVPPAAQMPATQPAASTARPLDPLLVLTGIVAGVAVLCLLLVGSRASSPRREEA
ncbi:plastocyanin/azurin family copper-binding protein [Streptomyces sp. NPDC006332]|uniref:plastocyanin/azurin family copper-binding protein n=1 Tax=Streptomyces sp. NPDC006332 TaxID=3155456 RepID=UPI0033A3F874